MAVVLHGVFLAMGLILPLGVQNVFIFQQGAYQRRFLYALPAVIMASICDTLLISLAVGGVSVVVLASPVIKTILISIGCLFLLYMGWATWTSKPGKEKDGQAFPFKRQIIFAASVSLLNPHAILDTIGVIGTSSLQYGGGERWVFASSCISVSWIWFLGLAAAGRMFGRIDASGRLMIVINKISACIIWAVAILLIKNLIT
ncbi:LysE/ArgO family amino acid transporter [Peribacillus kribbensis]|uniref:LysE/ArgO family amino acid transporter n=1 Tax=Peribacillus kribbensis TaxID=356658 RepID=UPI001FE13392|nr:LysE/ArgO family amino acid transporter [Peribacillus kribbensis]